jgi:hypothetical protein
VPVLLAYVACGLLAILALFQLTLIFGAPLGRFIWGGRHDVLPAALRAGSAGMIVLYAVFAIVVLQAANLTSILPVVAGQVAIWVLSAYFFVSFVTSAISPSPSERAVMTPINLLLAALCLFVAVTGHLPR